MRRAGRARNHPGDVATITTTTTTTATPTRRGHLIVSRLPPTLATAISTTTEYFATELGQQTLTAYYDRELTQFCEDNGLEVSNVSRWVRQYLGKS